MEEDIKILLDFIKYIRFNEEKHYTIDKYYTAIENSVEHMRKLTNKNKEQKKIIELMAESIADSGIFADSCQCKIDADECRETCEECVTDFFKKKARDEK